MATQEQQMQDLINAAKLKLQAQQQAQQENTDNSTTDIYKDIREGDIIYGSQQDDDDNVYDDYTINRSIEYGDDKFDIETDKFSDMEQPSDEMYDRADASYTTDQKDAPVFEGGPGTSQIMSWKKKYGTSKIFHTQILKRHFIFRSLTRFEYKQIIGLENVTSLLREEIICKTCTLFPYNYNIKTMASEDGGYPSTLAQIIMENSGFTQEYGIEIL